MPERPERGGGAPFFDSEPEHDPAAVCADVTSGDDYALDAALIKELVRRQEIEELRAALEPEGWVFVAQRHVRGNLYDVFFVCEGL